MFKIGEKVVCVDSSGTDLKLNKIYNIIRISVCENYKLVYLFEDQFHGYYDDRFVSIKRIRKNKLICIENQ